MVCYHHLCFCLLIKLRALTLLILPSYWPLSSYATLSPIEYPRPNFSFKACDASLRLGPPLSFCLAFSWCTFSTRVTNSVLTARWSRWWAKNQMSTNMEELSFCLHSINRKKMFDFWFYYCLKYFEVFQNFKVGT